MSSIRQRDASQIIAAYGNVELALRQVGRLLRTLEAGKYMWACDHKSAATGLRIAVEALRRSVPRYDIDSPRVDPLPENRAP